MARGWFADDYTGAREMFLAAAGAAGARVASIAADRRGPAGEALFTDVATIGDPAARNRFVVMSGLHGIEGFCGSACQIGLMRSRAGLGRLPEDWALIMVHATNPFGFAWWRRFDEHNVDLNRNFLTDFADPPANPRYRAVAAALAADPTDAAAWRSAEHTLTDYATRHGEAAFTEAASGGQYEDAAGIFFGGARRSPAAERLEALARDLLAGAERAVLFDIHTGIGEYGERVAFCQTPADDPRKAVAERLFGEPVRTPARGPEGGRARRGLMLPFLDSLKLAPFVLPLGVEFGTYPLAETIAWIRAENWLFHQGDRASPEGRRILAGLRHAFAPTDADWEAAVTVKSAEMFRRMFDGLGALAVGPSQRA